MMMPVDNFMLAAYDQYMEENSNSTYLGECPTYTSSIYTLRIKNSYNHLKKKPLGFEDRSRIIDLRL